MRTEAEYISDEYIEWEDDIVFDIEYIHKQREHDLIGKYLVISSSRYQSDITLFLQDEKYGTGYWTKFLSNARGFMEESAAIIKAKNFKYNNPRVVIVQANMKLKEVYSNGKRTR